MVIISLLANKEIITDRIESHCGNFIESPGVITGQKGDHNVGGKMSRDKGARFERTVAGMFKDYGYDASRTAQHCGKTGQAADVKGVPGLHIECKNCEKMHLYDWISQADRDCKASNEGNTPIVIHKANNKPVLVTMHFDDFMKFFREWEATND